MTLLVETPVKCYIGVPAGLQRRMMVRECESLEPGFCPDLRPDKPSRWCSNCRHLGEHYGVLQGYWWKVEYREVYNGEEVRK